jgi:LmbE family N-acetylglucosaminyl deacetylase
VAASRAGGLAFLLLLLPLAAHAQAVPWATSLAPSADAQSLPEDRGADGLAQTLRKLRTWASLMMIVAHPDDEDGGMMTYESRGQGARTALMTLTRGEGGQNAMSGEAYDALGLMRTNELLLADEYSGTEQFFSRVADFGFSKTKEETLAKWDHYRVLADVVRAVRINRPLVLTSVFTGNITDGHGHHQVSGEMAQEAFTAAGDASMFPDQIAAGLLPWSPLKVYARVPFFAASPKGMYDYATGKYSPVHVYDYVAKMWSDHFPAPTLSVPEGTYDPVLGQSYFQMAREGWSQQKSQYGGGYTPLPGPYSVDYHRYGSRVAEAEHESSFFDGIDVTLPGMASLAHGHVPGLEARLREIDADIERASTAYAPEAPAKIAPALRDAYLKTKSLMSEIDRSNATASEKYDLDHVLQVKLVQLNEALAEAFGLEVNAMVAVSGQASLQPQETAPAITPGAGFDVRVHVTASSAWGAGQPLQLARAWVETPVSEHWTVSPPVINLAKESVEDAVVHVTTSATAAPTAPYFTRPSIEQPYYDIGDPSDVTRPNTPYPVSGWAMFVYDGVPITLGQVVQTTHRVHGLGNLSQPLVVVPPLSVALATHAAIVPAGTSTYFVTATVTNEQQAQAPVTLTLKVPSGMTVEPPPLSLTLAPGEAKKQSFEVHLPADASQSGYTLSAVARSGDRDYASGFQTVGYPGLRPANLYRPATMLLRPVDVHVAPGLRIGYVMGTGDEVPEALAELGLHPLLLTREDLLTGDLGRFDTILIGIRAYSARPELAAANPRLLAFVHAGGTLVVEYQGPEYDHSYGPYPLSLGTAERVVDEQAPVTLDATGPPSSLLTFPNRITADDFSGWFEERGHSFLESWDPRYSTLTQTADPGQDPQRGGLIEARYGSGHYIYVAYALHRQLPEAVPGAFRILANLVSAGKAP